MVTIITIMIITRNTGNCFVILPLCRSCKEVVLISRKYRNNKFCYYAEYNLLELLQNSCNKFASVPCSSQSCTITEEGLIAGIIALLRLETTGDKS